MKGSFVRRMVPGWLLESPLHSLYGLSFYICIYISIDSCDRTGHILTHNYVRNYVM